MTDNGVDIGLTVPIYVDADIEVDDHDICNIVTLIYVGDDEECYEARVALDVVFFFVKTLGAEGMLRRIITSAVYAMQLRLKGIG